MTILGNMCMSETTLPVLHTFFPRQPKSTCHLLYFNMLYLPADSLVCCYHIQLLNP